MKRVFVTYLTIAITAALALSALAPAQPAQRTQWALSVRLITKEPHPQSPIEVEVTLRNTSPGMLGAAVVRALHDYDLILKDNRGVAIPFNQKTEKEADTARHGPQFSVLTEDLQPGEEIKTTFNLSSMYDNLTPGKYTLSITRLGAVQFDSQNYERPTGVMPAALTFEIQPSGESAL
jgi:hypothetical protein